jgi:DNA-binding CsgD family transcriptional regulator/tetratricopeptide (TPR) repeat protein
VPVAALRQRSNPVDTFGYCCCACFVSRGEGLAGRRSERLRVGRTLSAQSDRPFLFVLGEAGIGKSRLVRTAVTDIGQDGITVLSGWCLPMAANMPLLPIVEVLRSAYETDDAQWVKDALAKCPPYVPDIVATVLPEIEKTARADVAAETGDQWWRQRLFASLRSVLAALGRLRRTSMVIEDVHWADSSTLDLFDYLFAPGRPIGVPAVLTMRIEDPLVREASSDWLQHAKRSPGVDVLELAALSQEETGEQIELLTGHAPDQSHLSAIFRRSGGNALFTEQLVFQERDRARVRGALPNDLADAFSATIRRLGDDARAVARVLAIAARPLDADRLVQMAELSPTALMTAIRELREMHLVRAAQGKAEIELRHALLGEAVASEMLPLERAELHRGAAIALADSAPEGAAEIVQHWRLAGNDDEELRWTVRAGRTAEAVYAAKDAARHWLRAIELWDRCDGPQRAAGIDLPEVYTAAIDALNHSGQGERAGALAEAALVGLERVDPAVMAEVHRQLGRWRGVESPERGLESLQQAIELYEQLPPSIGLLKAYDNSAALLRSQGSYRASCALIDKALTACQYVDDPGTHMRLLALRGLHDLLTPDLESATRRIEEARAIAVGQADPRGDLYVSVVHTNILLSAGAATAEVVQAAAPGLEAMERFSLDDDFPTAVLRFNVARALLNSGDVDGAATLATPVDTPSRDLWPHLLTRAELETLRGEFASARQRFAQLADLAVTAIPNRVDIDTRHAELELWDGRPAAAWDRTTTLLMRAAPSDTSGFMGATLVLAARAAADLGDLPHLPSDETSIAAIDVMLDDLHRALKYDPFALRIPADGPAHLASWDAERSRLRRESSPAEWERAATKWDRLERPHRAAYSRWRQAEALLAHPDTRTQAGDVLRTAVQEAHQHVPLTGAIEALAKRARIDLTPRSQPTDRELRRGDGFGLTEREIEVLRLIGEGHTNAEIGKALFISPKTASVHVTNILRKLDVSTRAHAATVAARHGLIA